MYNESIDTTNRIISTELISNIFSRMNEIMRSYTLKANREEQTYDNIPLENKINMKREYSSFTSDFSFTIDFYDSTTVVINSYEKFVGIFASRLSEIKRIYSNMRFSYFDINHKYHSNQLSLSIHENSFDIRVEIDQSNN